MMDVPPPTPDSTPLAGYPADPDGVPLADLETAICQWAGRIASATCAWLALLAAFDRRGGWAGAGVRSCAHWLSWRCGLSSRAARDHLATAHALTRLPLIRAAFAAGTVSYSKVRAITRVAEPHTEDSWLNHALHCTSGQLERLVRAYRQHSAPPDERARQRAVRRVTWRTDDDGMLHLTAVLAPEEAAQLVTALDAAGASLTAPAAAESDSRAADALAALADAYLHHQAPGLVEPTHTLTVHVQAPTLGGEASPGPEAAAAAWSETSPQVSLPPAALQRLACDGMIRTLIEDVGGNPLRLGRRRRLPTRRLRAAVFARDRGTCQYPGCTHTRWLHIHHLTPWSEGGRTDLDGLTLICGAHHRQVHDEGITLRRSPDGTITAHLQDGNVFSPAPPIRPGPAPADTLARDTAHVTPHAVRTRDGGRLHLDDSLIVLLQG